MCRFDSIATTDYSPFIRSGSWFDSIRSFAFAWTQRIVVTLASSETNWEGGATYKPAELDYLNVSDGPGRPRVASLARIIGRYLEPDLVTVGFRGTAKKDLVDRRDLMAAIAPHIGVSQVRLANAARTGFVVVESNGVAAGWRTDGRTTIDEAPRPWWKLWK